MQNQEFNEAFSFIQAADIGELESALEKGYNFQVLDPYDHRSLLIAWSALKPASTNLSPDEMIPFLIRCGIDINHHTNKRGGGVAALHLAAIHTNDPLLSCLITHGADLESRDKNGNTPLWKAIMNYRGAPTALDTIQLLIEKGASLDTVNFHDNSPRDIINRIGGGIDAGYNHKSWDLRFLLADSSA